MSWRRLRHKWCKVADQGSVAWASRSNVQIEGQPASGLSLSNAGLGVLCDRVSRFSSSLDTSWKNIEKLRKRVRKLCQSARCFCQRSA